LNGAEVEFEFAAQAKGGLGFNGNGRTRCGAGQCHFAATGKRAKDLPITKLGLS